MEINGLSAPQSTILVVDDTATNLQVLVRTLQTSGHRILAAKDGPTALDIARRTQPELMLLDIMMPGMDGFEVCRLMKAQPETRDTMVIFLSGATLWTGWVCRRGPSHFSRSDRTDPATSSTVTAFMQRKSIGHSRR